MVSYYNPLPYSQKHSAANLAYSAGQPWQWPTNYHTPPNHQFLGDMDSPHSHHQMYYNPMFHTPAVSATSDWHSPASSGDNFSPPQNISNAHHLFHHQHHTPGGVLGGSSSAVHPSGSGSGIGNNLSSANGSESVAATNGSGHTTLNENTNNINDNQIAEGLPSPPITVSGSEISSPGAPASSASPHHMASHHLQSNGNNNNNNSPITAHSNAINNHLSHNPNHRQASPVKSPFYDWMKKPSYPAQPTPGMLCGDVSTPSPSFPILSETPIKHGKTRTKDKYRVVYTDFQRLELEKEYCTSRYITIRRKTELAQTLSLSERQVKIWFQNRRAKERKQSKKGSESSLGMQQHNDYASLMDTKPKLEPGLQHLQHSLHSMTSMAAMSMPAAIGLHHHHHLHGHHHHHHALAAHSAATHHPSLHQSPHSQISAAAVAAAVSVGSLSM